MAAGEHRSVTLDPDDTVIISATPIPGNEKRVSRVINNLTRSRSHGLITVSMRRSPRVRATPQQRSCKTFYNVVQPQALVPSPWRVPAPCRPTPHLGMEHGNPSAWRCCEDGDVAVVLENGKLHYRAPGRVRLAMSTWTGPSSRMTSGSSVIGSTLRMTA